MASVYRLADEPRPSTISNLAVNPFWPLLASMLAGVWLAWPWFIVNATAVGSPTRRREIVGIIIGLAGSAALLFGLIVLRESGTLPAGSIPYAVIAMTVWKLGVSYWLYMTQQRTFGIWEYYGGVARNGMLLLVIGFIAGPRILKAIADSGGLASLLVVILR